MFSMGDVKFIAQIEYDIYTNNGYYHYPREKLVLMINNIIDTFHLLENIKKKELELEMLIN